MLLVADVGNTHTVFGVYDDGRLRQHWRIQTERGRTADEYGVFLGALLKGAGNPPLDGLAVSSVVPPITQVIDEWSHTYLHLRPLIVGPGVHTGMPLLYDDPRQVGTDRVVNAVAAYARTGTATIVVDCGTATKFEFVSATGEYCGGAIAPGLGIAADALFERAARLYRVELVRPQQVIGRNTVHAIQSGLVYGYGAMIDGMVRRIRSETATQAPALATGGFAPLLVPACETVESIDEFLTLDGLRLIYERNSAQSPKSPN
ncbi:MAG: type III pantothenate kinase [Deltaproteobacteria bacterium]|nr:type III pantothenate kinase [Deltaproteobacteria bacterium]